VNLCASHGCESYVLRGEIWCLGHMLHPERRVMKIVLRDVQPAATDRLVTIITHKRKRGRPRIYASRAEQQAAYRARKRAGS